MRFFTASAPLPKALFSPMAWVAKGRLFVAGGTSGSLFAETLVYSSVIGPDGDLGVWRVAGQLPTGGRIGTALKVPGTEQVIVFAGANADTTSSSALYTADVAGDGSVKFRACGSPPYEGDFYAAAATEKYIFVAGNSNSPGADNNRYVFFAPHSKGGVGSWRRTTDLPHLSNENSLVSFTASRAAALVNFSPPEETIFGDSTKKWDLQVGKLSSSGDVLSWQAVSTAFANRIGGAALDIPGRGALYIGGYNTPDNVSFTEFTDAVFLPINPQGAFGAPSVIANLAVARDSFAVACDGKFVWVIGGEDIDTNSLSSIEVLKLQL